MNAARPRHPTPAEVLPISGTSLLLGAILEWDAQRLRARVEHDRPGLYTDPDGSVPAWAGLEYMAQAVGALAGIRDRLAGRTPRPGMLLGTRRYRAYVGAFAAGIPVTVEVVEVLRDNLGVGVGVYDCTISGASLLAEASIKMIQMADSTSLLPEEKRS